MTNLSLSSCDILISGGDLIDGTGAARKKADVAISGDRIIGIGNLHNLDAKKCHLAELEMSALYLYIYIYIYIYNICNI